MLILAMESSAKPASVAVCSLPGESAYDTSGIKLLGQYYQNNGFSHSRTLLSSAESLLESLGLKPCDIGLIAVARGPGSFTGVRIGISAAKGLAWGLDIPVRAVSTLEAIAYQTPQTDSIVCPVMDARCNQVYNALFQWRETGLNRLCEDRAISLEDLASELNNYGKPCLLVGDGTSVCKEFEGLSHHQIAAELLRFQTAYGVTLAALNTVSVSAVELEPTYLRPSQAERLRTAQS